MDFRHLIAAKRDGLRHSEAELREFAKLVANGGIPDYQIAAWLMAAYLHPLDADETAYLTLGMADSGRRIDLTGLPHPWVDKHSTGGVGDKATLVLLPLLAAGGLTMVKMSGRGLGITGGTIDKLASVPGFRLDLKPHELKSQAGKIGLALTGQSPDLAPADKVLYALRDVTETVSSIPFIVSSILSKKIAGGAEIIMVDVKCGSGAFMPDLASAVALADALEETGLRCGLRVHTQITDMSQPLGASVGNALEVQEALDVLAGGQGVSLSGPVRRFRKLCVLLAAETFVISNVVDTEEAGVQLAEKLLSNAAAARKAEAWFVAQGASWPPILPRANYQQGVVATSDGFIAQVDAGQIGELVLGIGGGRKRKDDEIDPAVGVVMHVVVGDIVKTGQPLATLHTAQVATADDLARLENAITVSEEPVSPRPLLVSRQSA